MNAFPRRWAGLACALITLAGCSNDDWFYRPRDASAVTDGVAPSDGPLPDQVTPPDGTTQPDGSVLPDAIAQDGAPGDGTASDVVSHDATTDAPPSDGGVGGLTLRASGIMTTGNGPQQSGTLRLTETGFELGERACAGSLCLAGGLVP